MSNDSSSTAPAQTTLERRLEQLSPAKRALLEQQLRARSSGATIGRRGDDTLPPASLSQELLWQLDSAMPGQYAYNVSRALRLRGPLDHSALQRAVDALVVRHAVLRTTFASKDGAVVQVIAPPARVSIENVAIDGPRGEQLDHVLEQAIAIRARRPFDLAHEAAFRVALIRLDAQEHVLLWVSHHVALDGWSATLLFEELTALYEAATAGRPPVLPEPPIRFSDYAVWQRESLASGRSDALLRYWRGQLANPPERLSLPASFARPAAPSWAGGQVATILPADVVTRLRELGSRHDATLYMVLVAAYVTLLHRYSGAPDIMIGSPVAGRTRAETERVVGYFANTLVHRNDVSGDPTFGELLGRVRRTALGAIEHQDVPLEQLIMELRAGGAAQGTQLFQCVLTMEDAPPAAVTAGALRFEPMELDSSYAGSAKFDLLLLVRAQAQGLRLLMQYSADLFDADGAARMLGHLRALLDGAIADSDRPLSALPLVSPDESEAIERWNAHEAMVDATPVPVRFDAQAARTPEALAVVCGDERLTYAELRERANALTRRLQDAGIAPGSRVGVTLDRSADMIIAILGVMKAGAAYVPLLADLPAARARQQAADASVRAIVTHSCISAAEVPDALRIDIDSLDIDACGGVTAGVVPEATAYVLFTSGSTGRPKGVEVTHANLASYTSAITSRLAPPAGETWRFATVSTLAADLGHTSIFPALTTGGALHVIPEDIAHDGARFAEYMGAHDIDVLKITPAHLLALMAGAERAGDVLPRVWLICGGEALQWDLAERVLAADRCRLLNHYGPTEATVGACTFEVTLASIAAARRAGAATVPIGHPLASAQAHVLDGYGNAVPVLVAGELYVSGPSVAKGYVGRDDLTSERFVVLADGRRAYRTGDRVRRLPDGSIEFLGRGDDQVKVRGYRVELTEIERALAANERVTQSTVLPIVVGGAVERLAAFVVARASGYAAAHAERVTGDALIEWLGARLPSYMIPAEVHLLDALPLTANGKIDRRALEELAAAGGASATSAGSSPAAPATETQAALATIWAEVLKREQVGIHDNFLDLGGHSLLAIRVLGRLSRHFGVRLPLRALFDAQTIAQLAERVDAAVAAASAPSTGV
jgi:amino acid adenylation domain-containing protein